MLFMFNAKSRIKSFYISAFNYNHNNNDEVVIIVQTSLVYELLIDNYYFKQF